MIILGFLSYHDGYLRIPNREIMKEFEKALKDENDDLLAVDICYDSKLKEHKCKIEKI